MIDATALLPSHPVRELFVYYRAQVADAATVQDAVEAMQARLRAEHPGLVTRMLRRPDAQDGCHTWMEVYAIDSAGALAGIDAPLQAAIDMAADPLQPLLTGPRHTEAFVVCGAQSGRVISMCAMPASSNTEPWGSKPARA